jgi:tyrosine-protein phosphatase SIW14
VVRTFLAQLPAVALAAALCAAPATARRGPETRAGASPRDGSHTIAEKIPVRGVPNFGQVTPTLFRGGQPTELGFRNLAKMGVEVIVDLRQGDEGAREQKEVEALGMKFVGMPWHCRKPEDVYFARFLALLQDNPHKKIFVHCRLGIDRTGMMIASYRMAEQDWTAAEALREMKAFGFSSFHEVMCNGLAPYEQRFPSVESSSPAFSTLRLAEQKPAVAPPPKP